MLHPLLRIIVLSAWLLIGPEERIAEEGAAAKT